jgi:poly(A) polymerase Pap1
MKTRNLIVVAILLLTGSLSADLFAQETLKALIKKCESMENVNVNVVRSKNKETRELEQEMTSISFRNNQALVNEFIAAFAKDKEMADQEIENKSNGKITNLFYRFGDVSYSFSQHDDTGASVSVMNGNKEKRGEKGSGLGPNRNF